MASPQKTLRDLHLGVVTHRLGITVLEEAKTYGKQVEEHRLWSDTALETIWLGINVFITLEACIILKIVSNENCS